MKKLLSQLAIIAFVCTLMSQSFAAEGIKTIVKGSVNGKQIKVINIFKREMLRSPAVTDTIKSGGQFQLAMNLKESGFYIISDDEGGIPEFIMYLNPGDQITMKIENGEFVMTGKGSKINQLLYAINKKYAYDTTSLNFPQTYKSRINEIQNSTDAEVVLRKPLLLGYMQGEYLSKLYDPYIESKVHPSGTGIMEVNTIDLNMLLVPEIVVYPGWNQLITELMFAKMNAGQLKVHNIRTWVADFGNAIENEKLRERYMVATLDYAVSCSDFTAVAEEIKAALPFIKDPQRKATVNALKAKITQRMSFYKNSLPGTDFSAFTFHDINGKQVRINDFKGKLIYIDIWTTGCMPCMAEAPYLSKLEHEMEGKDIVFLSISCDSGLEVWKRTIKQYHLTSAHLLRMNGGYNDPFFVKVGKSGVPRFLILDKAGKMLDYNSCKRPSNPLLKIYLTELLNQTKS